MNVIRIIHHLIHCQKVKGKYGPRMMVKIAIEYDTVVTCFLSMKQWDNLTTQLHYTNGSSRGCIVWGAFEPKPDGEMRFIWSHYGEYEWMCEAFNADPKSAPDPADTVFYKEIPTLPIPESVEIANGLIDTFVCSPEEGSEQAHAFQSGGDVHGNGHREDSVSL